MCVGVISVIGWIVFYVKRRVIIMSFFIIGKWIENKFLFFKKNYGK